MPGLKSAAEKTIRQCHERVSTTKLLDVLKDHSWKKVFDHNCHVPGKKRKRPQVVDESFGDITISERVQRSKTQGGKDIVCMRMHSMTVIAEALKDCVGDWVPRKKAKVILKKAGVA